MTERQKLKEKLLGMAKNETISLPWYRYDEAGYKADYIRNLASKLSSDYKVDFKICAPKSATHITVTRIS